MSACTSPVPASSIRPARQEARARVKSAAARSEVVEPVKGEHPRTQSGAQGERPLEFQHCPGRAVGRDRSLAVAAADGPAAGGDEVVELKRERAASLDPAVSEQRLERLLRAEARKVPTVALLGHPFRLGPARLELLRRVLVDADVHPEVRLLDVVAALLGGDPGA